jgi:hypothetical protein
MRLRAAHSAVASLSGWGFATCDGRGTVRSHKDLGFEWVRQREPPLLPQLARLRTNCRVRWALAQLPKAARVAASRARLGTARARLGTAWREGRSHLAGGGGWRRGHGDAGARDAAGIVVGNLRQEHRAMGLRQAVPRRAPGPSARARLGGSGRIERGRLTTAAAGEAWTASVVSKMKGPER